MQSAWRTGELLDLSSDLALDPTTLVSRFDALINKMKFNIKYRLILMENRLGSMKRLTRNVRRRMRFQNPKLFFFSSPRPKHGIEKKETLINFLIPCFVSMIIGFLI
jgi:hypothetical protein